MSLFADLFSCGRARKPREIPTEPHDANDTIGATPQTVPDETATANDILTTNTTSYDVREPTQSYGNSIWDQAREEVRKDTKECDDAVGEDEDGNGRVAVIEEKAKQSGGWMLERRVLVTATPPRTADAALVAQSESETREITPPVRRATPEPELSETTPTTHATTEPGFIEGTSTALTKTKRAPEEVNTPLSVENSEPLHETPVAELATAEPELPTVDKLISVERSKFEVIEAAPLALEAEVVADVPIFTAKAPVRLLDLPPEIRKHIYDRMSEKEPIRMCRHDDPALADRQAHVPRRQFYNLTQVCHKIRGEFLPAYAKNTEYVIDLWAQKTNLADVAALKGKVSMDIDAACFDLEPIDLLPLIRCLARTCRTDIRFASTEGVVFRSIQAIVDELNKLLPSSNGSNNNWVNAVNGPMKRIDLHLFPHEDVRQYYRFRGAEPLLRIVYPSAASEEWMQRSSKSDGYEGYLTKTGLDTFDMHVVVGHASRRTTNEGRLPLDWRMSLQLSRLSIDGTRTPRMSMDLVAARMSIDRSPRMG